MRKKTRKSISYKLLAFTMVLTILFSLTACSKGTQTGDGGGGTNSPVSIENEKPEAGGTIYMGSVEPQAFNPLLNKSESYMEISKLLFEGLVEYDEKLQIKPLLAKDWEFVNNSSQCLIRLKDNIVWSDGHQFTANDVKFSIDTIKSAQDSIYKANVEHIYSSSVVDRSTIKIVFDQPYANAIDMLVFPIIPQHVYSKGPKEIPVGTGSYKVSAYNPLKYMDLAPNGKWAGDSTGTHQPYIQTIRVMFINDLDAFSTAFQSRELDVLNTSSYDWEKYNEMKNVRTYKYSTMSYDFIGLNFNNPIFQDKAVRKAITLGINRKSIIDKYLLGNATLVDVPVNPISWLYDGKGVLYNYSKVEAQKLLNEAGFKDTNNDKIFERDTEGGKQILRFTLITNEENDFRKKAAEDIKKNLAEIGIAVDIQYLPFDQVRAALDAKQFDAVMTGYNLSPTQDLSFAFHSTQIAGGKNFTSYTNTELDNLLQQAYMTLDNGERKNLYRSIQYVFREEVPCISLFFRDAALVTSDKINGDIKPLAQNPYRGIENWFVPKSMQK